MASSLRKETAWLVAGDLAFLVFSLWLALCIRNFALPSVGYFFEHLIGFVSVFLVSLCIFFIAGLYEKQTRLIRGVMGGRILGSQIASVLIAAVLFFFLPFSIAPKTILAIYLAVSVIVVSVWRFSAIPRFRVHTREPSVVVGGGPAVLEMLDEVNNNHRYFLTFSTHLDTKDAKTDIQKGFRDALAQGVRLFVVDTRDARVRHELAHVSEVLASGSTLIEFVTFYEDVFDRVPLDHIDNAWLLGCLPKKHLAYDVGKRVVDIIGSLIGFVLATPFVVVSAFLLLCLGGTPFIFHKRIGRGGKPFRIIKLRTMLFNDHGDSELQKKNRVTHLGRILRVTRIDELPQLVNIFAGELSFIGPRPELPSLVQIYDQEIPFYETRHLITPGLSGWAQIWDYDAPRGGADVARTKKKLSYDLFYLKRRSFVLDLIIGLKTLRALASFSGK